MNLLLEKIVHKLCALAWYMLGRCFDILPLKIVTLQYYINRAAQTEKTLLFSTFFQGKAVEQYWIVYSIAYYDVLGGSNF